MDRDTTEYKRLLDIMDRLRKECPWDKKQTFQSLKSHTIEECFELSDAISKEDYNNIKEELGDLLLHIVFYAKIGEEEGLFNIEDITAGLNEKLIYRHPHIFSDTSATTAEEVAKNWEQLKIKEKERPKKTLEGVPSGLPALIKAFRIQQKAAGVGFDWQNKEDVWDKVKEECAEFEQEALICNKNNMEEEFGDILFTMVNCARLYGIDPENALERCNQKFTSRFNYIEDKATEAGGSVKELSFEEANNLWREAKQITK